MANATSPRLYFQKAGGPVYTVWANEDNKYNLTCLGLQGLTISLSDQHGLVNATGITTKTHDELLDILEGRGTTEAMPIVAAGTPIPTPTPVPTPGHYDTFFPPYKYKRVQAPTHHARDVYRPTSSPSDLQAPLLGGATAAHV